MSVVAGGAAGVVWGKVDGGIIEPEPDAVVFG